MIRRWHRPIVRRTRTRRWIATCIDCWARLESSGLPASESRRATHAFATWGEALDAANSHFRMMR